MIRHFYIAAALSSLSCAAHGFTGVYLGLDTGLSIFTGDHTYTDVDGKDKEKFTKLGAILGGHIGVLKEIGKTRTVVGLEAYLNTSTAKIKDDLKTSASKIKVGTYEATKDMSAGIAFVGGKLINPKIMIYVKAAFERSNFKIKYKNSQMSPTSKTRKKSMNAFVPGIGLHYKAHEKMLSKTDKLFFGFEYNYAGFYSDINTNLNPQPIRYEFKQAEHRLIAKVTYMI